MVNKVVETEPLKSRSDAEHSLGKLAIALFAMVLIMVWSVYYMGPSEQSLGLKSFILFWLRELFIVAIAVIAMIVAAIGWLKRRRQQNRGNTDVP